MSPVSPQAPAAGHDFGRSPLFIFVLVAVTAVAPFSMQLFIPALPLIQKDFGVTQDAATLALSLSMLAIAVANGIYGPVSDKIGRKPTLVAGLLIFLAGCALSAAATNIELLIAGRILQGAGGAAGLVMARAMVRDVYGAQGAARAISYLTMAMVTAPMVAPMIGGVLTDAIHWRAVFVAVGVLLAPILFLTWVNLRETAPPNAASAGHGSMLTGVGRLLRRPRFLGFVICGSFSMAVFFAFLGAAPFLTLDVLGYSAADYGFLFVLVSGAYISGTFLGTRLHTRLGEHGLVLCGSIGSMLTALVFVGIYLTWPLTLINLFAPAIIISIFQGFVIPNSQAGALNVDARYAGSASGLTGFAQMGCAALSAQLVADFADGTVWPMAITITVLSIGALFGYMLILFGGPAEEADGGPAPQVTPRTVPTVDR